METAHESGGVEALVDRSRGSALVVVRRQHPRVALPSASTVGAIFKKRGLVGKRRRVRRSDPYKDRLGPYDGPNRVWCADFKGRASESTSKRSAV